MKQYTFKVLAATLVLAGSLSAWAQTCQNKDEIPEPTRKAIETAAQQAFDQTASGDVNGLKTNSIPSLQTNFSGIAAAVSDNKDAFPGAQPPLRGLCGANGMSPSTAEFDLPGLPVGKYAVTIQDFVGNKGPYAMTIIFQDLS